MAPPRRRRRARKPTSNNRAKDEKPETPSNSKNINPARKVISKSNGAGNNKTPGISSRGRPLCPRNITHTEHVLMKTFFSTGLKKRVMRFKLKTEVPVTNESGEGNQKPRRYNNGIWKKKLLAYIRKVRSEVTESDLEDWIKGNPWIMKYQGNPSSASDLRMQTNVKKNLDRPIEYGRSCDDESDTNYEEESESDSIDSGDTTESVSSSPIRNISFGSPETDLPRVKKPLISARVVASKKIEPKRPDQSKKAERVTRTIATSTTDEPSLTVTAHTSSGVHIDNERPSTSAELRRNLENQNNPPDSSRQGGTGRRDPVGNSTDAAAVRTSTVIMAGPSTERTTAAASSVFPKVEGWKTCEICGGKKPCTPTRTSPSPGIISGPCEDTIQHNRSPPSVIHVLPAAAGCSFSIRSAPPSKNPGQFKDGNVGEVANGPDSRAVQPPTATKNDARPCGHENKSDSRKRKTVADIPVLRGDVPHETKNELRQLTKIMASIQRMNFLFRQRQELRALLRPLSMIYQSVNRQQERLVMPSVALAGLAPPNPRSPRSSGNANHEVRGAENVIDIEVDD